MRIRRRVIRSLLWGMFLVCSILAGGVWFAFSHFTDSETAKRMIREGAKPFFPGSTLEMSSVDMQQVMAGVIKIKNIVLNQSIDDAPFPAITIPYLQVKLNPKKVLKGEIQSSVSEVIVSLPTMQICRRKDGTWNLQGLLADPWPGPAIKDPPTVSIKKGTIELLVQDETTSDAGTSGTAPLKEPQAKRVTILRDVNLTVRSNGPSSPEFAFDGTAKGDTFEQINLEGTIDPTTGKMSIEGDLSRLTISEMLLERIPREVRPAVSALGLKGGEVNLSLGRLELDPAASDDKKLKVEMNAHLSAGVWECKTLPFPINELSAQLTLRDRNLTIEHAEGRNGMTTLRIVRGQLQLGNPATMPFDFLVHLDDLLLDDRLRRRTPPEYDELWDVFKPTGKINTAVHVVRETEGGLVGVGATVQCRDVSGVYRHFPYPVEHMTGTLTLQRGNIDLKLRSHIGSKPIVMEGTIENPGPDAVVRLGIEAESVPVDQTLLDAMPPDVRKVVDQFQPEGSAKASVKIVRKPTVGPMARPEGDLRLDAVIDLQERCSIKWAGLPYPVRNLTGKLKIHPDLWQFEDMKGDNGQAIIKAAGQVRKLPLPRLPNGEEPIKIDVALNAQNLLFNEELRDSLQPAWRKTWNTINPIGATDVVSVVSITKTSLVPDPSDSVKIELRPRQKSNIRLVVPTLDPNFTPVLPMEDVTGVFNFHNGVVTMKKVNFDFRGAPISFEKGTVRVEDNGKFELSVGSLQVKHIRFDNGFRKIMPPMMASFAERLDDGKPFTASGDLEIGWSGVPQEPAWCRWKNTKAIFIGNALKTGIPLENIQGQLEQVAGWSDGKSLEVAGKMNLANVKILGQQITGLTSNFSVNTRLAKMDDIQGALLGGRLSGNCYINLDSPNGAGYGTHLMLQNARLEQYGLSVPGRQNYRGLLNAELAIAGLGPNVRSLRGSGQATVTQGDLGELPVVFQFVKFLNEKLFVGRPRGDLKTAFDEAEVKFQIHDGMTTFSTINLIGNAVRLGGEGTLNPQGDLDIGLRVRGGRGLIRLPIISTALNEVSREMIAVQVRGTASNPTFEFQPLPTLIQGIGRNRDGSTSERSGSRRPISR